MCNSSRVKVVGPLVPYISWFRAELESQGYRPNAVCDQLRLMAHVSRWLAANGFDLADLTPKRVDEFLVARRAAGYVLWRLRVSLNSDTRFGGCRTPNPEFRTLHSVRGSARV